MKRLYTVAELDMEVGAFVTVDAPDNVYRDVQIDTVRNNGRFDVIETGGHTLTFDLVECKVFIK